MEEKMGKEGKTVLSYFKRSGVCKNINDVLTAIRILSTEQKNSPIYLMIEFQFNMEMMTFGDLVIFSEKKT